MPRHCSSWFPAFVGQKLLSRLGKWIVLVTSVLSVFGTTAASAAEPRSVPNVLLIVADDLGFSDLGCYGSEIETPNLDRLASTGLRLTQFYTTGRCCPSRASLLTGHYPHRVGLGHMVQDLNQPGYRGRVSDDVKTIAEYLAPAGYRSYLSGKWHLGTEDPTQHGFDEFYGTLVSAKTFWDPNHFVRLPLARKPKRYAEGEFYGTDALADQALEFLQQARKTGSQPWFLYLAFHAPHFPLHAPKKSIDKYSQRYVDGWDKLREERLKRMRTLGIVPQDTKLSTRSPFFDWGAADGVPIPSWNSLPAERRADLARRMAIYAAMIDRMDDNIGRILTDLEQNKELANTLIIFTSDNGACAEWDPFGFDIKSSPHNKLHSSDELNQMGGPGTFHSVGSGWANASNTPWRLFKHFNHEGGTAVPCIVHWPNGMTREQGSIDATPAHLIDVVPTLLDCSRQADRSGTSALPGESLLPLLRDQPLESRMLFFEHEGNRALRHGRWKIVALRDKPWELYDMILDRTESNDLAPSHPELVETMDAAWEKWAAENNVTPLPADYGVEYLASAVQENVRAVGPIRKLADGFRFTEGPAWDGERAWYFSDLPDKTLHRWTEADGVRLVRTGNDASSNGIVTDPQGGLVFCEVASRRVVRRSVDGKEKTIAESCEGRPIGMPNDLWLAPSGEIYFTIPRTNAKRARTVPENAVNGTVCRISSDGQIIQDVGVNLKSPNGIVGTRDGKWLYVADPGSQKCWKYAIQPDGTLADQMLAAPKGSDGLAVDEHGNLYTTGKNMVLVYSPDAQLIAEIPVPESPANLKFGGKNGHTLFITARTSIYMVEMNVRGN
ncbi:sulfatase-like hydrolase/transferase [Bremerella sp.]|uniref:sulfatase-like hydrolase/transferase n=1 Tax=Bremerella sp. TaxID=2795602 RepID=UPI003918929B